MRVSLLIGICLVTSMSYAGNWLDDLIDDAADAIYAPWKFAGRCAEEMAREHEKKQKVEIGSATRNVSGGESRKALESLNWMLQNLNTLAEAKRIDLHVKYPRKGFDLFKEGSRLSLRMDSMALDLEVDDVGRKRVKLKVSSDAMDLPNSTRLIAKAEQNITVMRMRRGRVRTINPGGLELSLKMQAKFRPISPSIRQATDLGRKNNRHLLRGRVFKVAANNMNFLVQVLDPDTTALETGRAQSNNFLEQFVEGWATIYKMAD